ncbi:Hydroxyproline-rich glyco family isoform 2 [Chlorella sorokiniana]|uniref:Hydroxyproline-rich glyco family isoform 2 n=1 Tax=Chlorella sorokiniana TaxID=3076 RepID=A0A2P6TSW4_CHLSO|nr:Hydroxyproline-rich glyco family isoform 2 [Chlorella sorokiniana]|eukprot:PRW57161.1 Hydroxyproline-rich glyco family isoform 2 [Chlorella sorokiniana]
MSESSEARRKRLKAMLASAQDGEGEGGGGSSGGGLANPLADEGGPSTSSGPFTFFSDPMGAMERSRSAQQQRREAFQGPPRGFPQQGQLPMQQQQYQQQMGQQQQQFGGGRGRGGGRQNFGGGRGGGRGRGGRGGGNSSGGGGIEAFFNPSMLENPWEALERRLLGGVGNGSAAQQRQQQHKRHWGPEGGGEGEGRAAAEGALDRPWH